MKMRTGNTNKRKVIFGLYINSRHSVRVASSYSWKQRMFCAPYILQAECWEDCWLSHILSTNKKKKTCHIPLCIMSLYQHNLHRRLLLYWLQISVRRCTLMLKIYQWYFLNVITSTSDYGAAFSLFKRNRKNMMLTDTVMRRVSLIFSVKCVAWRLNSRRLIHAIPSFSLSQYIFIC